MSNRRRPAVWLGPFGGPEFGPLFRRMGERFVLSVYADVRVALETATTASSRQFVAVDGADPVIVIIAIDVSARFGESELRQLVERWPLATILGVTSSLADGRRRGGAIPPGLREVPWHDAAVMLDRWVTDSEAGRAGWASLPRTLDREEWLLQTAGLATSEGHALDRTQLRIAVAAMAREAVGPLVDLVEATGFPVVEAIVDVPSTAVDADVLVWDAVGDVRRILPILRRLSAERPDLAIVLLDSFPRGDVVAEAVEAGAACVLGRPVPLIALAGTLEGFRGRRSGVGSTGIRR